MAAEGGTRWARICRWILPENARLPLNIQGSFTCRRYTTWDRRFYFPSEGRRAEDIFALKNPRLLSGLNPRTWVPKASTLNGDSMLGFKRRCHKCMFYTVIILSDNHCLSFPSATPPCVCACRLNGLLY